MKDERKKLYLYSGINFFVGIIVGIILFHGQLKSFPEVFAAEYSYDKQLHLSDLVRVSWLNIVWFFAVFMARSILPAAMAHPILLIRGIASSFSAMYIMSFIGVKEAVISVLPQCFSIIPAIIYFSVCVIEKRRKRSGEGKDPSALCRMDCIWIILSGVFVAMLEMLVFSALWRLFG